MAVYHDARCRLCRREGMKLFLKGQRCFSDKCAFERRGYAPGEHGKSRRIKETNYGQQLREKKNDRRVEVLPQQELRLKGRPVDIPSLQVKAGDEIALREKSRKLAVVLSSLEARRGQGVPEWMELNTEKMSGRV